MKLENSIGWCDATINAVTGCDKVSPGCKNCYAAVGTRARVLRFRGIETWGPNGVRQPVNFEATFRRLNKLCICDKCHETFGVETMPDIFGRVHGLCGGTLRRIRLFADSNSDWLDPKWPIETLAIFLNSIRLAPNIDVLLLTKRIENFSDRLNLASARALLSVDGNDELGRWIVEWQKGNPPKHVWLGVSAENQELWDERCELLGQTPAAIRFVSAEPLLENIDCGNAFDDPPPNSTYSKIDWLIVGGESGKNRRDCGVYAIINMANVCFFSHVPVYVKQDCAFKSGQQGRIPDNIWALKQFPNPTHHEPSTLQQPAIRS